MSLENVIKCFKIFFKLWFKFNYYTESVRTSNFGKADLHWDRKKLTKLMNFLVETCTELSKVYILKKVYSKFNQYPLEHSLTIVKIGVLQNSTTQLWFSRLYYQIYLVLIQIQILKLNEQFIRNVFFFLLLTVFFFFGVKLILETYILFQ